MITMGRLTTYFEDYGALIPNAVYALIARMLAEQMRRRGNYDASNYLEKAAGVME